ncbi:MAG: hypothetical protein H8M99_13775 [Gloeobacteraceae cyanobacterium ES-bin-144]|nr:hypothetical protein [Verrucomicrobiales bacterium]
MAPAPAPQSDCEQGWTLGLEVLALKPYQSEGGYEDTEWDIGYRASLGYQFNDCIFTKVTYFAYGADTNDSKEKDYYAVTSGPAPISDLNEYKSDMDVSYLDWVIGQHFKPSDRLTLSPYIGLRWGTFDESSSDADTEYDRSGVVTDYDKDSYDSEFSGLGIVIGVDGTLSMSNGFSAYGTFKQSVLFGKTKYSYDNKSYFLNGQNVYVDSSSPSNSSESDTVLAISELGLGVQYDFCFSNVAANIRLGVEAQYWAGLSNDDSENTGLAGFVLGANFRF